MTFSEKIKELRKEKGISQDTACKEMGFAISSLRNYENGRLPEMEQIKKIQKYYNVPYEYLLNDECTTKNYGNINISKELGLSDKAIDTLKYFKNIDDDNKEAIELFKEEENIFLSDKKISGNTVINDLLNDKKFIETVTEYIIEEIINKDEIKEMKDYLNIPNELYEYTRLAKILDRILKLKEKLLQNF